MADIIQRKVKKGETLWNIAAEYGVPASQRTPELWRQWGYYGDPKRLPENFVLKIPTSSLPSYTPSVQSSTQSPTQSPTQSSSLPPTTIPSSTPSVSPVIETETKTPEEIGFSASFTSLVKAQKQLQELNQRMLETVAPTETDRSLIERAFASTKETIQRETERAMEEIRDQIRLAEVQRKRALEQIAASPVTSKAMVEDFLVKTENFDKAIARSIERLQEEENKALLQADYEYANQIRQQKLDYYNIQRQILQDNLNFLTTAFNWMLTGKQIERQERQDEQTEATNYLKTILEAYGGGNYTIEDLPPEVQTRLLSAASILGLDRFTINRLLSASEGPNIEIIKDTETGWVIGIDKNTGEKVFSTLMPGRTGVAEPKQPTLQETLATLSGKVQEIFDASIKAEKKVTPEAYFLALRIWTKYAPSQLKYFFQAYPSKQYLPNPTKVDDPQLRLLIQQIKDQEELILKTSLPWPAEFFQLYYGTKPTQ